MPGGKKRSRKSAKRTANNVRSRKLYSTVPLPPSHIRLLKVLPQSNADEAMVVELYVTSLESLEPFTYLAYSWEENESPHPIRCNGVSMVTRRNVNSCLRQFRRQQWTQPLWIDALCINQEDADEMKQQIQLMTEISSRASSTILWLGQDSHEVELQVLQHCLTDRDLLGLDPLGRPEVESGLSKLLQNGAFKR